MLKITRAAIKQGGVTYHVPIPGRHYNVIHIMLYHYKLDRATGIHGFMADDGFGQCFVNRKLGYIIAQKAGQLIKRAGKGPELFSEDVWEGSIVPGEPLYYIFKERYLWVDDMQETNKKLAYYRYCRVQDDPNPKPIYDEDPYKPPDGIQAVTKHAFQCGPYLMEDTGAIIDALDAELKRDGQPTPLNVLNWVDGKCIGLSNGQSVGTAY